MDRDTRKLNSYVKYLQQVILNLKFDIDNSKLQEAICELVQRIEKYIPRP